jgi:glycosyltransferase involved in cell wall biosynthesis
MEISIVIPVKNNIENLKKCIDCIQVSEKKPFQIIIVDDASDSDTKVDNLDGQISIERLSIHGGPSRARNCGARFATGDIILFIDADVFVKPDTLTKLVRLFEDNHEDAVVGIFDEPCDGRGFFSEYKNLWMKYTYETISERAALFFTSIAAIRRDVFFRTPGFDERYRRPSTEDTAFGNMLYNKGVKPLISPEISVFHDREYSFLSILKTDFIRASDLLKMELRKDMGNFLREKRTSVPLSFILSVFITSASCLLLIFGRHTISLFLFIATYILNYRYLLWLYRKKGFIFFLKSSLFIPIDQLTVFLGMIYGLFSYLLGRKF